MTSKIVVNNIEADSGINTITFINEVTAPTFNGNIVGTAATFSGNVDIAGALTYEDVTNVDSVGIVTARSGIHVTGGSVGLGTDNPSQLLHLHSDSAHQILLKRGGQYPSECKFSNSGNLLTISNNKNGIHFDVGSSSLATAMYIEDGGNIGIGTDNPSVLLHLADTEPQFYIQDSNSVGNNVNATLQFRDSSNSQLSYFGYAGTSDSNLSLFNTMSGGALRLGTTGAERLRITSGGNIGIGTDNPVGNLEVRDSKANLIVAKDGLTVKSNSDLATQYDLIQLGAGGGLASYSTATATADTQFLHNAYRHSGGQWKYRYADTAARLRVNSPGRTWIFESAASGSADADITFSEQLRILADGTITTGGLSSTPGTVAAGSFVQAAANAGFFSNGIDGKFGTASSHPLYLQVNGVTKATVTTGGAFSVGTTSPQQPNVPSMHLHSTANDDARIAITTPSKPNSRIGYFGLSNKFGMDVHNGFEVRDASASYATRFAINSTGVVTFGGQSYANASKSGGVTVGNSTYFDITGSSYVFVKIIIKVGYTGNANYQMHAQYDYVTCNYYTSGATATRTDILQVEAANAQFNYSDISITRPSNRTVRVIYAPTSGAGTHHPVLSVSGVFDSITVT